jgi:phage shock protein PspC (stress-responsive transcriptional regulator)
MRIAKPLLIVITPIGVIAGLREAYRFSSGLLFLMIALITFISVAMGTVIYTIRRERAEEKAREAKRELDSTS